MKPAVSQGANPPPRRRLGQAAPLALLVFAAAVASAQIPVSESVAAGEPEDSARLAELFHRLQVLQQDVGELRGLVEEQAFQIERLTKQQKEQYIDIDQRLVALGNQAPASGVGAPRTGPSRPPSGGSAAPERDAYTNAFNLMEQRRFEESAEAFNRLITDYPNGQYTPNAFYWLGELYLAMEPAEVEQARQSFAQVLALYPEHRKVADALYKLGVVHHLLDDNELSLDYLNRVIAEHPDSPAAGLARTYAAALQ